MKSRYRLGQRLCRANGGHITILEIRTATPIHADQEAYRYMYRYDNDDADEINDANEAYVDNFFLPSDGK